MSSADCLTHRQGKHDGLFVGPVALMNEQPPLSTPSLAQIDLVKNTPLSEVDLLGLLPATKHIINIE